MVKTLAQHMGMYSAYHRHPMNRVIHFVFVPAIVWTLMVALDQVTVFTVADVAITLGIVITALLLIWYLALDYALGVAAVFVFTALLVSAIALNAAYDSARTPLLIAGVVFVGSWVFQFIGHGVWEKRRPALFDNLFQTLIAPMFLIAETAFAWGLKRALHEEVQREMQQHLPGRTKPAASAA